MSTTYMPLEETLTRLNRRYWSSRGEMEWMREPCQTLLPDCEERDREKSLQQLACIHGQAEEPTILEAREARRGWEFVVESNG